jgi:protein gp37
MGTSIEDMAVTRRADAFTTHSGGCALISAEPLLGPINDLDLTDIHCVIGGGESGVGRRSVSAGRESLPG